MKQILLALTAIVGLAWSSPAVTFNVSVPAGTKACYIAGSFNGWDAGGAVQMQKSGTDTFTLTLDDVSDADLTAGFKYLSGPAWAYVEKDASGNEISNRTTATALDVVGSWAALFNPDIVQTTLMVNGYERRVRVSLPAGYADNTDKTYPVLYYTGVQQRYAAGGSDDAGDDFFAQNSWDAATTAEALQNAGAEGCILVEMYGFVAENIPYAVDDFMGSGAADAFIADFVNVVMPYVESNYRVAGGADATTIMGADLGGLLSLYAAITRPDTFGRCIAMSPLLWLNSDQMLSLAADATTLPRILLTYGSGETAVITDHVTAMADALKAAGADVATTVYVNAVHDDTSWGKAFATVYPYAVDSSYTPEQSVTLDAPARIVAAAADITTAQYALFNAIDTQEVVIDNSVQFDLHNDFVLKDGSVVTAQILVKDIPVDVKTKYYWNVGRSNGDGTYTMLLDAVKNVGFSSKKTAVSWHRVAIRDDESIENVAVSSAAFRLITAAETITMSVSGDHQVQATATFLDVDKTFTVHYGSVNSGSDMGEITDTLSVGDDCTEAVITYDFVTNSVSITETKHGSSIGDGVVTTFAAVPAVTIAGKTSAITLVIDPESECTPTASLIYNYGEAQPLALTATDVAGYYTAALALDAEGLYTITVDLTRGQTVKADAAAISIRALSAESAALEQQPLTVNAYEGINWEATERYKANFHTHTSQSFDTQFATHEVVDLYHNAGYKILALTDHDVNPYPWTNFDLYNPAAESRDPAALEMLAVPGVELSKDNRNTWDEQSGGSFNHHNDFFTGRKGQEFATLRESYAYTQALGGMQIINHPGQYWSLDTEYTPGAKNSPEWHAENFTLYSSLVGLEVYNQGNRRPNDRILWDQILDLTMPARPVWGYSCDDTHTREQYFRNYQYMLMPELTTDALKDAMAAGAQYFSYEPEGSGEAKAPHINAITVNDDTHTIAIDSPDATTIYWISGTNRAAGAAASSRHSTVVGIGEVFDYTGFMGTYVRALLVNEYGETCTQPFGFGDAPSAISDDLAEQALHSVTMYPNPATDIVNVSSSDPIRAITVHSMSGAMMLQLPGIGTTAMSFDATALPAGTYLATIATDLSASTIKLIVK
ncbi:MAG: alpha/beta hydrolase-fold protein [Muribaculaceae bacterium]